MTLPLLLLPSYCCHLQEYCDCGTLAAVAAEWRSEPESDQKMLERLQLLQDCARGLQELHSRNVVHGDLVGFGSSQIRASVLACLGFLVLGLGACGSP